MAEILKNYQLMEIGEIAAMADKGRVEVGDTLGLTGCELSVNCLPAGTGSAFVHAHKRNEEVYLILGGSGIFYVDGEEFPVREGSVVRVEPAGKRAIKAGQEALLYICIQAGKNSLVQKTFDDGVVINDAKTSWL